MVLHGYLTPRSGQLLSRPIPTGRESKASERGLVKKPSSSLSSVRSLLLLLLLLLLLPPVLLVRLLLLTVPVCTLTRLLPPTMLRFCPLPGVSAELIPPSFSAASRAGARMLIFPPTALRPCLCLGLPSALFSCSTFLASSLTFLCFLCTFIRATVGAFTCTSGVLLLPPAPPAALTAACPSLGLCFFLTLLPLAVALLIARGPITFTCTAPVLSLRRRTHTRTCCCHQIVLGGLCDGTSIIFPEPVRVAEYPVVHCGEARERHRVLRKPPLDRSCRVAT